jgi:polyisoprenoid-binding protein YceI
VPALPGAEGNLTGDYVLDPAHTRTGLVARHAMVTKVCGSFTEFGGKVRPDERNPGASSAWSAIKVRRIDTQNAELDAHLRSSDFFPWTSSRRLPSPALSPGPIDAPIIDGQAEFLDGTRTQ